jgi:hypothetical protein
MTIGKRRVYFQRCYMGFIDSIRNKIVLKKRGIAGEPRLRRVRERR